ncbi:MAG TPA: HlyD family secretion protein [Roseiarcus sp.]|nr:HlyD family secretion protein [Roseiarcus sp.]
MAQDVAAAPAAFVRPAETAAAPPKARRSPRRLILPLVVIAAAAFGVHYGYYYFTDGRFLVSTDDAYVGADSVIVAPKIAGYIVAVKVRNNQEVREGEVLARIDPGDYRLALDAAKAKVATQDATITRIGRQIDAQAAMVAQAQAQVAAAAANAASAAADEQRAALEFDRAQKLAQTNFGSQQRLEQANADKKRTAAAVAGAKATFQSAEAQLAYAKANTDVLATQKSEAVHTRAELANAVERAARDLSFTEIRAPFDGVIGNKAVEVGQYVQPGTRLLAVVPLDKVYVDANYKETQLADIAPGQKVDVAVDAFDGKTLEGYVRSIAPASGAQFSLLPPDNATGNFTKIVQRVTVRIGFDAQAIKSHKLRPGLSVVATIHSRDEALPKPSLISALGLDGVWAKSASLVAGRP